LLTQHANGVQVDIESWPVMTKEEVAISLVARMASQAENRS
jgi:hypothetical protein